MDSQEHCHGEVIERMPDARFQVRLDDGRQLSCFVPRSYVGCRSVISLDRLIRVGDRVWVEPSPDDPAIGRFVRPRHTTQSAKRKSSE
jgi:translation initiation factor IF-1